MRIFPLILVGQFYVVFGQITTAILTYVLHTTVCTCLYVYVFLIMFINLYVHIIHTYYSQASWQSRPSKCVNNSLLSPFVCFLRILILKSKNGMIISRIFNTCQKPGNYNKRSFRDLQFHPPPKKTWVIGTPSAELLHRADVRTFIHACTFVRTKLSLDVAVHTIQCEYRRTDGMESSSQF